MCIDESPGRAAVFREEVRAAGLLVDTGLEGLYARGPVFEEVLAEVVAVIEAAGLAAADLTPGGAGYRPYRFPPILPRAAFEKTDYIESFPDLTGAVHTFSGGDREHRRLLADRAAGEDWSGHLGPGDTMLVSAACHPVYAILPRPLPEEGVAVDVHGYCFRHEPSPDPYRMQAFRMFEFVRVGTPDAAAGHRLAWIDRALSLLGSLGLDVAAVPANDPFFGRAGKLMADGQLANDLKTEIVTAVRGPGAPPVAIASCNHAESHFGERFDLRLPDGGIAHTACTAFGLERITLALFATHGVDPANWPVGVREALSR